MTLLPEVPIPGSNNMPLYNIGVVTRMTGISMATLRAWERRYDFPEAERTSGGHRLYSEIDIMRLRWVKARIDDGMQTSQAIQALRHQEANGNFNAEIPQTTPIPQVENEVHHIDYESRLVSALLRRDLVGADQVLGEALASSSPENLILHIITPALAHIGDAWENNQINVAVEHMATNYLRQKLLMWMVSGPPPVSHAPIVLACAPDEWHEGSLLVLGALLRRRRWPVVYLGQSLPFSDLASFVREIKPAMVILVAMTELAASRLLEWPQWLPEAIHTGKPVIGYGGRIYVKKPEWQLQTPGVFLGHTFQAGLDLTLLIEIFFVEARCAADTP